MLKKRGQSAIEFIILVGAVTFFFLIFLFILQMNISDENWKNKNFMTKEIALGVQNEIALAENSIDGYYRNFTVPLKILDSDYSIDLRNGLVYLNTTDGRHALALPIANVTGNVQKGTNLIKKIDGKVYLNQ